MAGFDQAFIDEVRAKTDLVDLVSQYVKLEKRGGRYWGLCPFHSEKSPSFSVVPDKQFYICFGCQAAGDVFKFIQQREGLSFYEAVVHLAKRARLPLPRQERTPEEEAAHRERTQIREALEFATRYFQYLLQQPAGRPALSYFTERGLREHTIAQFRLGYAAPGWEGLLRTMQNRFPVEVLLKAGLVRARDGGGYYDQFRDRVLFPITDIRGRTVGFGGRTMSDEVQPKYLNSPETPFFSKRHHLFGLSLARDAIRSKNQAIIVEGYMDAIAAHQAGITNTVAALGTALTAQQAQLLRQQAREVVIAFDSDGAGQAATIRGLKALASAGCDVFVLRLPDGKDPDDFLRSHGGPAFRELIEAAIPLTQFELELTLERHDLSIPEGKAAAHQELVEVLATIPNQIARESYAKEMAERLGVSYEALFADTRRQLRRLGHKNSRNWNNTRATADPASPGQPGPAVSLGPLERAERTLLGLLLGQPELIAEVAGQLAAAPLAGADHEEIFKVFVEYKGEASGLVSYALDRLSPRAGRLVATLAAKAPEPVNAEAQVRECMQTIQRHRIQRRIDELNSQMQAEVAAGGRLDPALQAEWLELHSLLKKV